MGVFKDKDYMEILRIMLPLAVSFTAIDLPDRKRGLPSDELVCAAGNVCEELGLTGKIRISKADGLYDALPAVSRAGKSGSDISENAGSAGKACEIRDVYVVFGSLSLMQLFIS